jgi:hypothetical protein
MRAFGRADGVDEVFDPNYRPADAYEAQTFEKKQGWVYAILRKIIKTPEGKRYVDEERASYDAQAVLSKLVLFGTRSTHATLDNQRIMSLLTTMRISDSTKTNLEFVNHFMSLVQQYNDQQTDYTAYIASGFTRTLLEASVADVGVLP